ncbi:LCP family glycopolymer transferase [Salinithrix halophila]|uniref:LCP family protein n=1 Tax=Salinithrix halophila TaxID=1485204 RepID=A0ABV8JJK8_9BACL
MDNNSMGRLEWSRSRRYKKGKKKRWWTRFALISLLIVLAGAGYFFYQVWGALAGTYDPLEKSDKRKQAVTMDDPFTILLLGTDARKASTNWRPDVIILAAVNPHKKSVKMVSIPRDTYVQIANTGGDNHKINASAYYGRREVNPKGPGPVNNTAQTVEHFLNVPVDYYIKVNFQGFIDVVDALGGVDVNVKFAFSQAHFGGEVIPFKPGPKHLNGNETLAYVRMRKQDPRGDAGRNERQREVMTNLLDQAVSINTVTKVDELLKAVGKNLSMGIQPQELLRLQSIYKEIPKQNIQNEPLKGENRRMDLWYFFVNDKERQRVSNLLRQQLGLKKEAVEPMGTPSTE